MNGRRRSRRGTAGAALVAGLVAACAADPATPPPVMAPEGVLPVLGPDPWFSMQILPRDWVIAGPGGEAAGRLSIVRQQGIPALHVVNGDDGFVVARRTNAFLLATPFLSWSWNMTHHGRGIHPVRLVIGFDGGDSGGTRRVGRLSWMGSDLPSFDRMLSVAWGESALQRGNLTYGGGDDPAPALAEAQARYIVRGGREHAQSWWLENLDLAKTYGRLWPEDEMRGVKVVFIGVAAVGGRPPVEAHVSGIVLSR
jgi:hypothetical protein